jgi:mono/diheme cytochrome c family protein
MSDPRSRETAPRRLSDEELIDAHKHAGQDETHGGAITMLPLAMLFIFSGLIFFGGTYLGLYGGHFARTVHDEHGSTSAGIVETKVDIVAVGKRQYLTICFSCHQNNGMGTPGVFPPLANSEWVTGSEERLVRVLLHGLTGPITVAGQPYGGPGSAPMPSFGPGGTTPWSDDNIAAVLTYIRQEWGNSAPPITPERVAEIRTRVGPRGTAWTAAELEAIQ